MNGQKKYLAAIGEFPRISFDFWHLLDDGFKDWETAWNASEENLVEAGLKEDRAKAFCQYRTGVEPERVMARYIRVGVAIVSINDPAYPELLKEIYHPPYVIYFKGTLSRKDSLSVAVVGSRKPTDYGRQATEEITRGVAENGVTIVSGLAMGLDGVAHRSALIAGGRTIAVLAHGLDMIYPPAHNELAEDIIKKGALISEYPLGVRPQKQHFPARNRLISGMARGVLVSEAGEFSGTLHTASFALEQNRQVYAVPGSVYSPLSIGPNELIRRGAIVTCTSNDILEDLGIDGYSVET